MSRAVLSPSLGGVEEGGMPDLPSPMSSRGGVWAAVTAARSGSWICGIGGGRGRRTGGALGGLRMRVSGSGLLLLLPAWRAQV